MPHKVGNPFVRFPPRRCLRKSRLAYQAFTENTKPTEEEHTYENIKQWLNKGKEQLPKEKPKERHKKQRLSYNTIQILEARGRAKKYRDLEEYEKQNKLFRKAKKEDRTREVMETIVKI